MQLFYVPEVDFSTGLCCLPSDEARHSIRVLRLRCGDGIHITDGQGNLYRGEIAQITSQECVVRLLERHKDFEQRHYCLQIGVAPTKNPERLEWFVEKATEIGIDRITPLVTEHSERRSVKHDRLLRVAVGAIKQSLKAYLPLLDDLTRFDELITRPFEGIKLIAHCQDKFSRIPLHQALRRGDPTLILIGPEGDFSDEEITLAMRHGFRGVSLGGSRLRTETAAVASAYCVSLCNEP